MNKQISALIILLVFIVGTSIYEVKSQGPRLITSWNNTTVNLDLVTKISVNKVQAVIIFSFSPVMNGDETIGLNTVVWEFAEDKDFEYTYEKLNIESLDNYNVKE